MAVSVSLSAVSLSGSVEGLSPQNQGIPAGSPVRFDELRFPGSRDLADLFAIKSSAIGEAVQQALGKEYQSSVPSRQAVQYGSVERVILNTTDPNDEGIDAVIEQLRYAKNELCIQTYRLIPHDQAAQKLFRALAEKQRQEPNFQIFLAVNNIPWEPCRDFVEHLERCGVHAHVAIHPGRFGRQALHSKLFLFDGTLAMIGGDNIDNQAERDILCVLRGPIIEALLADFDDAFLAARRIISAGSSFARGELLRSHARNPIDGCLPAQLVPISVLAKPGIAWRGDFYRNAADQGLLAAFAAARHEINIISPNLNDPNVMEALAAAARRGVKVNILLPKDYLFLKSLFDRSTNRAVVRWIERMPRDDRQRVSLRWFSEDGKSYADTHAKFVSIDRRWCYVGSQNMDNQSWSFSRELGVGIDSDDITERLMREIFIPDWEHSIPAQRYWYDWVLPAPAMDWKQRWLHVLCPPLVLAARIREIMADRGRQNIKGMVSLCLPWFSAR